jgi:hypothetical protein
MPSTNPPPLIDIAALARAIRFALVCTLLVFCYFNIDCAFHLSEFSLVSKGMFNGKPLPSAAVLVLQWGILFTSLSVILPFCAVLTLFSRELIRTFYALGILTLLTFVELAIQLSALLSVSKLFIEMLGANPTP